MLKGKKSVVEIMDTGWRERDENSSGDKKNKLQNRRQV